MEKTEDLSNPSYYKDMVHEPIEVMKERMTHEQFEGFLWGNIIKYALRYSRKEEKKKTAEKILEYASWLSDIN